MGCKCYWPAPARSHQHAAWAQAASPTGSSSSHERDVAVNYLGVVRVGKAFLPLLRRSAGEAAGAASLQPPRVLIVSSMSGKVPVPFLSSYASSKHARVLRGVASHGDLERVGHSRLHGATVLPPYAARRGGVDCDWLVELVATTGEGAVWRGLRRSVFQVADEMLLDWAWDSGG